MLNERSENAEHGIRVSAMLLFYPALDPADRTGNTVSSPFSCSCLGVRPRSQPPSSLPLSRDARRGMSFLAWYFEKCLGCTGSVLGVTAVGAPALAA